MGEREAGRLREENGPVKIPPSLLLAGCRFVYPKKEEEISGGMNARMFLGISPK